MFGRSILAIATLLLTSCTTSDAQTQTPVEIATPEEWADGCKPWDDWDKPALPIRIHANTYYVGTCGISSILIVGAKQHFLLDSGTEGGARVVLNNIKRLGFEPLEIFAVSYSHEHFDHVGGMAHIIENTTANLVASPLTAPVFASGEADPGDPQFGMHDAMTPVKAEMIVDDGETIIVDDTVFTAIATPGHSPGALSWHWKSCDGQDCKSIVYADSLSPISRDNYRFSDHPEYVAKFRAGLERLEALDCDILLTPHPSASQMLKRAATGSFVGGMTCKEYADGITKRLDARLTEETASE